MLTLLKNRKFLCSRPQKDGLNLFSPQGFFHGRYQQVHLGHQRIGLAVGVILSEGDHEYVLGIQQNPDVFGIQSQTVIGGYGQKKGPLIAELSSSIIIDVGCPRCAFTMRLILASRDFTELFDGVVINFFPYFLTR